MKVSKWIEILSKENQDRELMIEDREGIHFLADNLRDEMVDERGKRAVIISSSDMV